MRRLTRAAPLVVALAMAGVAPAARAQAPDQMLDARWAEAVRTPYMADLDTVHAWIVALANAIPAHKYGWRPGPGVRSASEALMHVASEWYACTPMSVAGHAPDGFVKPGEKMGARLAALETITEKDAVLAELDRGQLIAYARALGVTPPGASSRRLLTRRSPWAGTGPAPATGQRGVRAPLSLHPFPRRPSVNPRGRFPCAHL